MSTKTRNKKETKEEKAQKEKAEGGHNSRRRKGRLTGEGE